MSRRVAVVGAGVMGAAAASSLARRGHAVTLLERFTRRHDRGSSHGGSRIFRVAYPELHYGALAVEALGGWRALESRRGTTVLDATGGIDHGEPDVLDALAAVLTALDRPFDRFDAGDDRWPMLRIDRGGVFHPEGGRVRATDAWEALLDDALAAGASLREGAAIAALEPEEHGCVVVLDDERLAFDVVVVTAGPWSSSLLAPHVPLPPLTVTEETPAFFAPRTDAVWPSFIHWSGTDTIDVYGLDDIVAGIKLGEHATGAVVDPDHRPDEIDPARIDRLADYARDWLPGVDPVPRRSTRCLYTSTPSTDFAIGRVGSLVVAAGFSGHGFKFAPAIGDLLADLTDGRDRVPDPLRLPA